MQRGFRNHITQAWRVLMFRIYRQFGIYALVINNVATILPFPVASLDYFIALLLAPISVLTVIFPSGIADGWKNAE
jgi:hypothetical protein